MNEEEELTRYTVHIDIEAGNIPSGTDNWRWEHFSTNEGCDGKDYDEFVTEIWAKDYDEADKVGRALAEYAKCEFIAAYEVYEYHG